MTPGVASSAATTWNCTHLGVPFLAMFLSPRAWGQ